MENEDLEPNWTLLEEDPEAFFHLEKNYTIKNLKKAYAQWLKKYKPEKNPQEFILIRESFEKLKWHLEKGIPFVPQKLLNEEPRNIPPEVQAMIDRSNLIYDGIEGKYSLEETYQNIKELSDKSNREYYHLAILSDVVACDESFSYWLAKGLKEFEEDDVLYFLLIDYCHQIKDYHQAMKVCYDLKTLLPLQVFAKIAHPLYSLLVHSAPFDISKAETSKFLRLLQSSKDKESAFYYRIKMTQQCIFKYPSDVVREMIENLYREKQEIQDEFKNELWVLAALFFYRNETEKVSKNKHLKTVDAFIQNHFCNENALTTQDIFQFLNYFYYNFQTIKHNILKKYDKNTADITYSLINYFLSNTIYKEFPENETQMQSIISKVNVLPKLTVIKSNWTFIFALYFSSIFFISYATPPEFWSNYTFLVLSPAAVIYIFFDLKTTLLDKIKQKIRAVLLSQMAFTKLNYYQLHQLLEKNAVPIKVLPFLQKEIDEENSLFAESVLLKSVFHREEE